jgi:hypothetical protein
MKRALSTVLMVCLWVSFRVPNGIADDKTTETHQEKSAPKNIGGLLFDVDEGVEIQKGVGGSVYVKSNREYMQQKFREIEARLQLI